MYRPNAFAVDDIGIVHAFIRAHGFATIACVMGGGIHLAYAPVALDGRGPKGMLRFHLALRNPVSRMTDGTRVSFSFMGPHAYVSPDWYRTLVTVPTWNYMAVEASGAARRLDADALRALLVDLSAQEEKPLRPKPPWTIEKVAPERTAALMGAIVGFEVALDTLEGKFKLSRDKKPDDLAGVIAGLEARGDAASAAVAKAMKKVTK